MNDGGPAFARPLGALNGEEWSSEQEGMSLRDYFAAKALAGYLACYAGNEAPVPSAEQAANRAYQYADAMLAAREAKS